MAQAKSYTVGGKQRYTNSVTGLDVETGLKPSKVKSQLRTEEQSPLALAQKRYFESQQPDANLVRQADDYAASVRQARIDAINQVFAPRIQAEQQAGQGRLSRVAALNFSKGIVGSGVDTTFTEEQKGKNQEALAAIEAQRTALVNEAFGIADKLGKERREQLTVEKQKGAEANLKKYQTQYDEAIKSLQMFGKAGYSLEDIDQADPNTTAVLRKVAGLSDEKISTLLKTSAPEGTYQWSQAKYVGNQAIVPKTVNGQVTLEAIPAPKGVNFNKPEESSWKFSPSIGKAGGWYNEKTKEIDFVAEPKLGTTGKSTEPQVSWDDYLNQARKLMVGPITKKDLDALKQQYDADFPPQAGDTSDLTPTERRKLEQAGLLKASRQEQLDYLYGKSSTGSAREPL